MPRTPHSLPIFSSGKKNRLEPRIRPRKERYVSTPLRFNPSLNIKFGNAKLNKILQTKPALKKTSSIMTVFLFLLIISFPTLSSTDQAKPFEGELVYQFVKTFKPTETNSSEVKVYIKKSIMRADFPLTISGKSSTPYVVIDHRIGRLDYIDASKEFAAKYPINNPDFKSAAQPINLQEKSTIEVIGKNALYVYTGKIKYENSSSDFKAYYHQSISVPPAFARVPPITIINPELDILNYLYAPVEKTILIKADYKDQDGINISIKLVKITIKNIDDTIFKIPEFKK